MSDRDEFGAFLVGFIVGGLSGAIASLLLAPQSGEETRALIKDKSIELRDKAATSAEDVIARAEAAAAEARARAEELSNELRARGESVVKEVRERGENVVEAAKKSASKTSKGKSAEA